MFIFIFLCLIFDLNVFGMYWKYECNMSEKCMYFKYITIGVVPGGGVALLYATKVLDELDEREDLNADQKVGVNIVRKAMQIPAQAIINNSGKEGAVYCGKMLELAENGNTRYGYDAATGKWADLFELGVIDPVKVQRTALQDSSSVAGLMTTTEAVITDLPKKADAGAPSGAAAGMGGGMGVY